uniref:AT-rich interactive domain-containing protein 2 n=1 Tax=Anthurium amnicola TaxID=1678845 RepID=A0A1D1ZCN7_9ARAE
MVSSHSEKSFLDDESHQFECKESCRVNCSSQATSFVEIPLYQDIPEKPLVAGEESDEVFSHSQGDYRPIDASISESPVTAKQSSGSRRPKSQYDSDPGNFCSPKSIALNSREDVARSEHMKRPLTIDRSHQHLYKRARQVDDYDLPFYFKLSRAAYVEPLISVAACKEFRNNRDTCHEEPSGNASGSSSSLSWVPNNPSEGECRSEQPMQILSPYSAVNKDQSSGFIRAEDVYFFALDYYPRRYVALGPDYQADIPTWSPRPIKSSSKESHSVYFDHVTDEDADEKFMGTHIIPMPDFTAVAPEASIVPVTRSACSCHDEGSILCVKQHVMEVREKLKEMLGLAIFNEMGFCDMGEYAAEKWTEEEEQTFLEVVSANPASLGKNFWEHLPRFLPSRTSKELVSYYFNVFVLRKRAEQNRLDPLNIDSDNDEWQESDDGEFATEDCGSDSVVETPGDQDDAYNNDSHEEDGMYEDNGDGDASDDFIVDEDHSQEFDDFSKGQIHPKSSFVPGIQHRGIDVHSVAEDHDVQDDSCTSYEAQHAGINSGSGPAVEYSGLGEGHNIDLGLSNAMDLGRIVSPGAKSWEMNYFFGQQKNVDFLPTCHVIEEVFGKGSWPDESEDGRGIS